MVPSSIGSRFARVMFAHVIQILADEQKTIWSQFSRKTCVAWTRHCATVYGRVRMVLYSKIPA